MHKLLSFLPLTIRQFFNKQEVRREVWAIAKSAAGSTDVSSDQISDASTLGKELLTAENADAAKAALDIEDTKAVWGQITGDITDQADLQTIIGTIDYAKVTANSNITQPNNSVIIKNNVGAFSFFNYSSSPIPLTLPVRDNNGNTKFVDPIADQDAATKKYVDSRTGPATLTTAGLVKQIDFSSGFSDAENPTLVAELNNFVGLLRNAGIIAPVQ